MAPKIKSQGIGPTSREVRGGIAVKSRVKFLGAGMASFGGALAAWALSLAVLALVPWWAKIPLGLINGITIGILFIVGHDACHGPKNRQPGH